MANDTQGFHDTLKRAAEAFLREWPRIERAEREAAAAAARPQHDPDALKKVVDLDAIKEALARAR
jgi:hypothetical protein